MGFPGDSVIKHPPAMQKMQEMQVLSLGWEDTLEEGMATFSRQEYWSGAVLRIHPGGS